ncbi:MAG: phospho-N-acetylmuramoyl-pentapeptide-transferase [bacterium]
MERAAVAGLLAAALVLLAGRRVIEALAGWGARQTIREEAPARHQEKAGTPTGGGILLLAAAILGTLAAVRPSVAVAAVILIMVGFGAIGLADDLLKVRRGRNLGLRARERLAAQALLAVVVGVYGFVAASAGGNLAIPRVGAIALGWLYVPFAALFVMAFVNAANLADGLDGLAAGLGAVAAAAYAVIAFRAGVADVGVVASAVGGAWLAFLWFNAHPAQVMMGDVGSNALGGALAALAIFTQTEVLLVVVGAVFVAEAVSVLAQVAYFKATGGRRIFRMSPLHHHFELGGWTEPQIVTRFWLLGILAAVLGLLLS